MEILLENYKNNPCGTLSIPYWKNKMTCIPSNMKVIHDRDYSPELNYDYDDEMYFRLYHSLENIDDSVPDWMTVRSVENDNDIELMAEIINKSYTDISISVKHLYELTKTTAYNKDLWIIILDKATGLPIGSGIGDFDKEASEGVLEWIQVMPEYRRRYVGYTVVNQLLLRMSGKAHFATVSGQVYDITNPEKLYRDCGFTGDDIWHILRIKTEKKH